MNVTKSLDGMRAHALRASFQFELPRRIYLSTPARLILSFALFAAFYLPLALSWPGTLLWLGPLVFGYPHLVASYRFLQHKQTIRGIRPFAFFATLTLTSLALHSLAEYFNWVGELPFGAWELAVASIAAITVSRPFLPAAIVCGVGGTLLWRYSWNEPLQFAAFALLAHNWVGFFLWISKSRGKNQAAALAATALFSAIHFLVFAGCADSFIQPLSQEAQNTGGLLAPWSLNEAQWYRMLVLYTFGLSMHYFVWLKAVPECTQRFPNSWRRSAELLREDLGQRGALFAALVAGAGLLTWVCSPKWGPRIYFQAALLHGWLELAFLGAGSFQFKRLQTIAEG